MDIGEHCSTCQRLDFLPLHCRRCGLVFCGEHRVHDCVKEEATARTVARSVRTRASLGDGSNASPRRPSADQTSARPSAPANSRPSAPRNAKNTPQTATRNREADGKKLGTANAPRSERATAALQRLKNLLGSSSRPPHTKAGGQKTGKTGPTPAQRHEAIGDPTIPQGERVYLEIERLPEKMENTLTHTVSTRPSKTVWMFFNQSLIAGQVLDRAASQLSVQATSLEAGGEPVDLHKPATEFEGIKLCLRSANTQ